MALLSAIVVKHVTDALALLIEVFDKVVGFTSYSDEYRALECVSIFIFLTESCVRNDKEE